MGIDLIMEKKLLFKKPMIVSLGRFNTSYKALEGTCPPYGKEWFITREQFEKILVEMELEIEKEENKIKILVAYCPNKKQDLNDKMEDFEGVMEDLRGLYQRASNINCAIQLIEEGFRAIVSY